MAEKPKLMSKDQLKAFVQANDVRQRCLWQFDVFTDDVLSTLKHDYTTDWIIKNNKIMERLTKQQFRDRYTNIKVYVDGKSKELQEQFFKAGIKWASGSSDISDTKAPFLYLHKNYGGVCFVYDNDMDGFVTSPFRQVKAEEILNIEIVEDEPEYPFKLKDEVVARASSYSEWFHGYFSNKGKRDLYVLSGGFVALDCLPFNEKTAKLIGTTDDYKEE